METTRPLPTVSELLATLEAKLTSAEIAALRAQFADLPGGMTVVRPDFLRGIGRLIDVKAAERAPMEADVTLGVHALHTFAEGRFNNGCRHCGQPALHVNHDAVRCYYADCAEGHPGVSNADEINAEEITCPTCIRRLPDTLAKRMTVRK